MVEYLHQVVAGRSLSVSEAESAMNGILAGEATNAQIAAFLVALKMKGETVEELVGLARAMRGRAHRVNAGTSLLVDTCGTGGDALGTINVSTLAALAVAGAGVRVAKHGNRSISGQFGSADLMEALGVRITMPLEDAARAIREVGLGFLYAPHIHPAMKHAQAARTELKMRTVFNLLGPLTNPAGAQIQVAGAPSVAAADLMAKALAALGASGFVVHGGDGMDEITTTRETHIWRIGGERFTVTPEDFGVPRARLDELRGEPVAAAQYVLNGGHGPVRDIVLVNAAAALVAAGRAADWREGVQRAAESLDSGAARRTLEQLKAV